MCWAEIWKISEFFIWNFSVFVGKNFSIFEWACFRNENVEWRTKARMIWICASCACSKAHFSLDAAHVFLDFECIQPILILLKRVQKFWNFHIWLWNTNIKFIGTEKQSICLCINLHNTIYEGCSWRHRTRKKTKLEASPAGTWRLYNVGSTLHRRWGDVVLTSCACWVGFTICSVVHAPKHWLKRSLIFNPWHAE